jgi:hypothetical protein
LAYLFDNRYLSYEGGDMINFLSSTQAMVSQINTTESKDNSNFSKVITYFRQLGEQLDYYANEEKQTLQGQDSMCVGINCLYGWINPIRLKFRSQLALLKKDKLFLRKEFVKQTKLLLSKGICSIQGVEQDHCKRGVLQDMIVEEYQSFYNKLSLSSQCKFRDTFLVYGEENIFYYFFSLQGDHSFINNYVNNKNEEISVAEKFYMGRFNLPGKHKHSKKEKKVPCSCPPLEFYNNPYVRYYFPDVCPEVISTR